MHCICTGITKEPLSGHQFSCCKLANAEAIENLRYIFVHIYVHMSILCARHNFCIVLSYHNFLLYYLFAIEGTVAAHVSLCTLTNLKQKLML